MRIITLLFVTVLVFVVIGCNPVLEEEEKTFSIKGRVVSDQTIGLSSILDPLMSRSSFNGSRANIGVADATIEFFQGDVLVYSTLSDVNGDFSLENVVEGNYDLVIWKRNTSNVKYWSKFTLRVSSDVGIGEVFIHKNPIITKMLIDGEEYNQASLEYYTDQSVDIMVEAEDPNDLPLQYVFKRYRQNGFDVDLKDWSSDNSLEYTFVSEDAVSGFSIGIGVKNNDDIDYDGFFGDVQSLISFTVLDDKLPAHIDSVVVKKDGTSTDQRNFDVGDTIVIEISASDPKSLPMQYVFKRYRRNGFDLNLQDWSSDNSLEYTFVSGDAVSGFSIGLGVKNNDGVDADGFFGDDQSMVSFTISDDRLPASISSVVVKKDGISTGQRNFNVGDTITIEVFASDPKSLPLQYIFKRYRQNGFDVDLQDWSSDNSLEYTFVSGDVISGFSIGVGVKNDDGVDADGFFGDAQSSVSFNVSDF